MSATACIHACAKLQAHHFLFMSVGRELKGKRLNQVCYLAENTYSNADIPHGRGAYT